MVRHFLKDGTEVESVSGRIITVSEFAELYEVIRAINKKSEKVQTQEGKQNA